MLFFFLFSFSSSLSAHSLKLECDKLASEKSEMQRHYIMVSDTVYVNLWLFYFNHLKTL